MRPGLLVIMALTVGVAAISDAQVIYRADTQLASRYLWRGMRRTDRFVAQSDFALGAQQGLHSLSAGAWLNTELGNAREGGVSDLAVGHWGPSEADLWIQYSGGVGHLRWSAGAIEYRRTISGADPRATEIYGELLVEADRWVPRIALWDRTGGPGGTYLETGLSFLHFVNPFAGPYVTWTTTALAGFQVARPALSVPADWLPAAAGRGLTHVGLSTIIRLASAIKGPVTMFASLGVHAQYSRDSLLRRRNSSNRGVDHALHVWFPLEVGLSVPLRRPP